MASQEPSSEGALLSTALLLAVYSDKVEKLGQYRCVQEVQRFCEGIRFPDPEDDDQFAMRLDMLELLSTCGSPTAIRHVLLETSHLFLSAYSSGINK